MVPELIARAPERTEGREALSAIDAWIAEWREPYGRRVDKATHARRFLPQARGYGALIAGLPRSALSCALIKPIRNVTVPSRAG